MTAWLLAACCVEAAILWALAARARQAEAEAEVMRTSRDALLARLESERAAARAQIERIEAAAAGLRFDAEVLREALADSSRRDPRVAGQLLDGVLSGGGRPPRG